ncbi:MAG TPA: SIS domain-containing protein [Gemmatimonadales bacterium]|nr:SIS domain-containing protein [Gemmatimonadales bacterium]
MSDGERIRAGLDALAEAAGRAAARSELLEPIVSAMRACLAGGGTIYFAGNGGSAADAQHLATEYVVRYSADQRRPLRAIALTTDSSALTAAGNDFGFQEIFARQLEALARPGDLLMVHSTSGNSTNLVEAVERARNLGVTTTALLGGDGGALASLVDHAFVVQDDRVNHIQELHLAIEHQIAAILTAELAG